MSPLPGRWDGVVVPASTGSLVRRAERWVGWEPPAPPPTPEGVSAHGPVHGPSVSAWISHDSGDPSFQKCRTLQTVATASTVLPGGTPPATPPHTLLLRLAGAWSQDSPGVTARGHCTWPPPAWHGNSYTPTSPLTSFFFTGLDRRKAGAPQPVPAELPHTGAGLGRWGLVAFSSGGRPLSRPQAQHCGLCPRLSRRGAE